MAQWRGRTVGVIFQFFQLLPTLTVVENVMLPMDFARLWSAEGARRAGDGLLEQVEMADQAASSRRRTRAASSSGSAIARALANDPPILVADEPTGNLDAGTAEAVFGLFETLVADGKTIVMVTHDHELAGAHAADGAHGRRPDPRRDAGGDAGRLRRVGFVGACRERRSEVRSRQGSSGHRHSGPQGSGGEGFPGMA